jgi:uncharacterized protein YyaL (SSP411 family)
MNRLADETSPYLLQHADNPVDWHPWGEEAINKAREENKPILLSIGYSACHWCHVMAHESFEDNATAEVMNRLFVNIKVDREERPDLDKIYQNAHHLIAQRAGGWPLTMFLSPEKQIPFFGGTYFPNETRHGMPAFTELLMQVAQHYEQHRGDMGEQGTAIINALQEMQHHSTAAGAPLVASPLQSIRTQLEGNFDREWGGFGGAPKFPHPDNIERLLRHWRATAHTDEPDVEALFMCALTLTRMVHGGIYDQLGGGFCRYSVDNEWLIPHFEKMLYDNGPLLALLAQMSQASGDESFRRAAVETADWVLRDMQDAEGGFYSSLDADSEGEEGLFYAWMPEQVRELVSDEEYGVMAPVFGLNQPANFEGQWHLFIQQPLEEVARDADIAESSARALLDSGRAKLLEHRKQRVWPSRDDKILTSWNALMIRGLAIAGGALGRDDYVEAAAKAVDFIRNSMVSDDRLRATYKDGRARFDAYLDDYAYLLNAVIELLQVQWNSAHLDFAVWLADQLLERFVDKDNGGFFFTAHDHEELLYRIRSFADDAMPSGNAIAVVALGRLGHLLGETRYLSVAEKTLEAAWGAMTDFPHGHASMITALDEYLHSPEVVVIRGAHTDVVDWQQQLAAVYAPRRLVFAIPADAELPDALAARVAGSQTCAYICQGMSCSPPIQTIKELAAELSEA